MLSSPQLHHRPLKSHQLNYQGCRCQLCERVHLQQNRRIINELYHDRDSQAYHPHHHKEAYLDLVDQMVLWEKMPRRVRLALPETCVFFLGNPEYWISKNKQSGPTKLIRTKSKMNMFEIQHFLLEGFLLHHPEVTNKRKGKEDFKEDTKRQCIVAAKYAHNVTQLLTLVQIQDLFKSKHKHMRDGLMYLQTLVGAHHSQEVVVKVDIEHVRQQDDWLFERAKQEARMFVGETKVTDPEYIPEKHQIEFERGLRKQTKRYLTYLSLKLILISSKMSPTIMQQAVFKWAYVGGTDFLWDIRVHHEVPSAPFWQSSVTQALQIKLAKTMSMMELQPEHEKEIIKEESLSSKAKEFSKWLESSTEREWEEMRVIRCRLEKLEIQKKTLLQSQKNGHGHGNESVTNRSFRLRSLRKRDSMMPINPQF